MVEQKIRHDFERARQKALIHDLLSIVKREPNELIPYHEIRKRVSPDRESYRGFQVVPVDQIVGSVDRFRDFDREFLPRHGHTAGRWQNIDRAYYQDVRLPPIQLYKVGDVYWVKDGNHRVSVAKERGVDFIDAEVIEGHIRVPLYASMSPFELLQQVEYAEYLRLTDLDRLRPAHDIRPTALGRYDEMWDHILLHQEGMTERSGRPVTIPEAVKNWYDEIYLPIARVVRERGLLDRFLDRSEADVYLWVMANRQALEEREGQELDPETTASAFADVVERDSRITARLRSLPRIVRRRIRKVAIPRVRQAGP
jgi:hypothetical protein